SRLDRLRPVVALDLADGAFLVDVLARDAQVLGVSEDVVVVVDVADQEGAALLHQADPFVVDQGAVLDGVDAGACGVPDALGAMGVRRDATPALCASSTATRSSSYVNCGAPGVSPGENPPP